MEKRYKQILPIIRLLECCSIVHDTCLRKGLICMVARPSSRFVHGVLSGIFWGVVLHRRGSTWAPPSIRGLDCSVRGFPLAFDSTHTHTHARTPSFTRKRCFDFFSSCRFDPPDQTEDYVHRVRCCFSHFPLLAYMLSVSACLPVCLPGRLLFKRLCSSPPCVCLLWSGWTNSQNGTERPCAHVSYTLGTSLPGALAAT